MSGSDRGHHARRYAGGAILLHWLTAAAFAFQIGLGWRMGALRGPETFAVFQLHKSIGITILLLTIARIAWRLMFPPPPFSATLRPLERRLAHAVHMGFYLLLLALPLSGWLIVSSSKVAVPTFLYGTVPWPHVPGIAGLSPAARQGVNDAAASAHVVMVWIALLAIALHVAGALKHQLFDRGHDLARMVPMPHRILSAVAVLIVMAFGGLMIAGRRVHLAPITRAVPTPASSTSEAAPAATPVVAPPPPPIENPAPVAAEPPAAPVAPKSDDWAVRMKSSSIRFQTAWSQGPIEGGFGKWQAQIRFNPEALTKSSAAITIDMSSVTATDGEQQSALPGNDWFAVATHPTATWRATRFRHLSGDRYVADGTLTLRGVTQKLPLPFTLTIAGDVATMSGTAKIDRSLFGIGQGEWTSTADVPALVTVKIAIKADRVADKP